MSSKILTATAAWQEAKKTWRINVQKNGTRKSFYCSTPGRRGRAECEAKAREWLESNNEDDPLFRVAWEAYVEDRKLSVGSSGQSSDKYIGGKWLLPALGSKRLSRITIQDWQDILNDACRAGLARATVNDIRVRMTGFRKFCRKKRWPVEEMDLLENHSTKKAEKRVLTREQVRTIWANNKTELNKEEVRDPYWNAYRLALAYGYRRGEVCGLQWSDYKDGWLTVNRSINSAKEQTTGKNSNARRRVKLSAQAAAVLEDQKAYLQELGVVSPWIFPDVNSGGCLVPQYLLTRWQAYLKHQGLPVLTFHEIRHSMISLCRADMPVELLKIVVGHSGGFDTFGIYGHETDDDFTDAAGDLEGILTNILDCGNECGTTTAG